MHWKLKKHASSLKNFCYKAISYQLSAKFSAKLLAKRRKRWKTENIDEKYACSIQITEIIEINKEIIQITIIYWRELLFIIPTYLCWIKNLLVIKKVWLDFWPPKKCVFAGCCSGKGKHQSSDDPNLHKRWAVKTNEDRTNERTMWWVITGWVVVRRSSNLRRRSILLIPPLLVNCSSNLYLNIYECFLIFFSGWSYDDDDDKSADH
jgi:hypothetical protein